MKWKLFLISILISGCGRAFIYPTHIKQAEEICQGKGGLHHIESRVVGDGTSENGTGGNRFAVCNIKDPSMKDDPRFELK